ncbi:putative D-amino-acid oxidase [Dioscorea sansibarensis]
MATPSAVAAPHIVICGGGVIGACTAYFLSTKSSSPAPRITIIERSSIACGASGKAGGFLALDWCSPPLSHLARASFLLHRSLSASLSGPLSYGYRPLHTLSLPIHPEPHSSPHSHSLPPWIDSPNAGSPRTIGTPETTAQVHPHLFTQTLISASSADVLIGEVTRIEVIQGRATGVILKDGREIPVDALVLALGPWSSRSPILSSLFGISGLKAHSIVVRPREPDAITPHALFLSYQDSSGAQTLDPEVYPRPTGEVYICGMSQGLEVPEDPATIVPDPESIRMLHKIARKVSSHLKDGEAEVVAEQACFLPCSDDGLPVIGEVPGVERCYVGTGHSCWGILNGPATGAALAELILEGRATTVDLTPFSPSRFLSGSKVPS